MGPVVMACVEILVEQQPSDSLVAIALAVDGLSVPFTVKTSCTETKLLW